MKKYTFVLPLIFILGLAYWRYTYIINPNFVGEPLLIKIGSLDNYNPAPVITANSIINIKSIIIYWVLFFLGNVALFLTLFSSFEKVKTIGFFYLLLSFFSAVFFALDAFWLKSLISFNLASILKNFLLSPLFTAIAYIMIEYFHSFGKPS
ncbi:MAG: hypothetical protein KAI29_07145 [Cyclobacteriaceae bacterium]|nr:hypothetical protein [Cyclobacteriaceae bacterium]